jgi:hypothetical protein
MFVIPAASSCMFDWPRMTAPASRSRRTMNASVVGTFVARASDPALVVRPATS